MKKIIAICLSLLLLQIVVVSVAATGTEPTIYVEDIVVYKCAQPQTIDVKLYIENNPGILGIQFDMSFDESVFTFTGKDACLTGEALNGIVFTPTDNKTNPINIFGDGIDVDSSNGHFYTVTFDLPADIAEGEYEFALSYKEGNIFGEVDNVNPVMESGKLIVKDVLFGDINQDGIINGRDVTAIRRYIAGGYEIPVFDMTAADVNMDGIINGRDVTAIRRYIAGGYGVVLGPTIDVNA